MIKCTIHFLYIRNIINFNQYDGSSDSLSKLPKNPSELIKKGWKDVTPEEMAKNTTSREFIDLQAGTKVRSDAGKEGANGFEGKDHYHAYNPNSTG